VDNPRIGEAALARLLDGWCTDARESLHRQLAAALTALISSGELPPGTLLPSERALASTLAVSRGTLVTAYTTLRSLGLLDSRQGSGTRVRGVSQPRLPGSATRLNPLSGPADSAVADLSSAALPGQDWVADVVGAVNPDDLRHWVRGHGYHPAGLPALRAAIARHCTEDGLVSEADQVLVTSGSQQALQLIATAMLAPGDEVLVEDPTNWGALDAFRDRGARLRTIPLREDGVDADVLVRLLRSRRPRLLYLVPAVHNPVGVNLRPAVAKVIAGAVAETGTTLVEDLSCVDTLFAGPPPPSMACLAPDAPVLSIGSLSKLFWGGLRVGWIRSTVDFVKQLVTYRSSADMGSSVPSQLAALRLLDYVPRARRARASQLRAGYEWTAELLATHLPDWTWVEPDGGASLWVRLPDGNALAVAEAARRGGVLVTPGSVFSAADGQLDRVRVSFAGGPDTVLEGVQRLASVWRGRRRLR
jgi:DNA-binding transcriptional MocR family regulator